MKLRKIFFSQTYTPIVAQIFLFFANYVIAYARIIDILSHESRFNLMLLFSTGFTIFVMIKGYNKMRFWLVGYIFYFFATIIAMQHFIEIPRASVFIDFTSAAPFFGVIYLLIIQIIVWNATKNNRKGKIHDEE